MLIQVLGPGCAKCKETEKIVTAAVQEAGGKATVQQVTDFKEMMRLGVMSTPAVVIDGKVMCSGRAPSKSEVMGWIAAPRAHAFASSSSGGCDCGKRQERSLH